MLYLKKLKIVLQYNYIYYLILFFSLLYVFLYISFIKPNSIYLVNTNKVTGYIIDKKINDEKISLVIKAKEKILVNYYFKKNEKINDLKYGDYVTVYGTSITLKNNTNFNMFNYKKYLYSKKIFYIMECNKIVKIKNNTNIIYIIKNNIISRINKCTKTKDYINAFVLGNKNDIDYNNIKNYQNLGVSHLFAISGMHVSILTGFFLIILKKSKLKNFMINIFLILYLFLTGFTPSIIRSSLLFILCSFNEKINIKKVNILILIFSILLFINPFYIYDLAFKFTFIISFFLILFSNLINDNKKYINKLIIVSIISFFASLPIVINNFYQVNILSILFNLIYVPYISIIVFPLGLLTFLFPLLDSVYFLFINILEFLTEILSNINLVLYFSKIPIIFIIIYYYLLYNLLKFKTKKKIFVFILLLIIFYNFNSYKLNPEVYFIDVGQGDSILLRIHNKNVLIDTGGKYSFNNKNNYVISNNILLPLFKSLGVKKINYIITSHGDFDHMGDTINVVNNIKIENVIFNCGSYNDLENELIKILDKKKIKYYSCIKELNIDESKLEFLNTKEYDNENDNSNVIYIKLNNYKFLFMGDAGVDKEKDILDKYNLENIDVLKVGHHGSKTSSSKEFINEIKSKYSVISVGKNNRYGHPNNEVLNNLDNSKIYRTDQDGSIMFKIKNDKLKIKTCSS